MEITHEIALEAGLQAGDLNMQKAGRTEWSAEDAAVASSVYNKLKPESVERPENGQTGDENE